MKREARARLDRHDLALSKREREVARLVALGLSNRQVAQTLGLKESTIKANLSMVYAKLRVHNRVALTLTLQEIGT